eukprot:15331459-Ditylum_brightwellii.AAC.2
MCAFQVVSVCARGPVAGFHPWGAGLVLPPPWQNLAQVGGVQPFLGGRYLQLLPGFLRHEVGQPFLSLCSGEVKGPHQHVLRQVYVVRIPDYLVPLDVSLHFVRSDFVAPAQGAVLPQVPDLGPESAQSDG